MFGIKYIKSQPTTHMMLFKNGKIKQEGAGRSFFYHALSSTLVAVPVGSRENAFMFEVNTEDYQAITVQGEITYRILDPKRIATMLDFSLRSDGRGYASEDPSRLGSRLILQAEMIVQRTLQVKNLKDALSSAAEVSEEIQTALQNQAEITTLGIKILGVSIIAITPTPDIARALEAKAREAHLKVADDAIYLRRMSAVENERAIRQNELDTEIAVEEKKNEIQETKMRAIATKMQKENELRDEQLQADIALEERRKLFVLSEAENTREKAEAEAYKVATIMEALQKSDPKIVQALAAIGMNPDQLIAQAFGGIAENAGKIGQLNMSPELLNSLMTNNSVGNFSKKMSRDSE